jgi:large conductance mechanosensitive channel
MLKEFRNFILRGNAIDLAIAVVIGAAFGAVIRYGSFLNAVFSLLTVGAAVFFLVIKPVNYLMERRKAGEVPPPEAVPEDIVLLTEIRDLLQSDVTPSRPT